MSCDYILKSDRRFSDEVQVEEVNEWLRDLPHFKPNGPRAFVWDDGTHWMEVDLETVNEAGDNIEDELDDLSRFNCIRTHVPHSKWRDRESDYLAFLQHLQKRLNWQLEMEA